MQRCQYEYAKSFYRIARKTVQENKIPFEISRQIPNKETQQAMQEAEDIRTYPEHYNSYENIDEFFKEVNDNDE